MSAGIIHEINNPLNFATTGLFTLRNKGKYLAPGTTGGIRRHSEDVEDGISRVKNIVSDLRMFTHPDTDSSDQVEVAEVVDLRAALPEQRMEGQGANRAEICRSTRPSGPTRTS